MNHNHSTSLDLKLPHFCDELRIKVYKNTSTTPVTMTEKLHDADVLLKYKIYWMLFSFPKVKVTFNISDQITVPKES